MHNELAHVSRLRERYSIPVIVSDVRYIVQMFGYVRQLSMVIPLLGPIFRSKYWK